MDLKAGNAFAAIALLLLAASSAAAQLGDEIPHGSYYAAVQAVYSGDYRTAARELARETQRGIHTPTTRWIDSICYYAMLGEVLFHQGRNAEALNQFDQACQLLIAYPNWLLQVRFQQNPRVDPNRARRIPTWGRSERAFAIGQFPATEQVLVGDLDAQRVVQQGGVYRTPMLLRVNAVEVMRMSALAIRRRNEILGPLGPQDAITRQLVTILSAGNLAPPNHWSIAWIDLLRGLAQEGAGKLDEADMLLGRSLVANGQFDHPLTGVGLLEQGRIAMMKSDNRKAARLFAEAGFSAYYFEDWDVLTESCMNGWINHLASGSPGVYPPLDPVASYAQANRLQHIAMKLRLAQAESLLWLGNLTAGTTLVDEANKRIGEMKTGLPGIHLLYLQAAVQILQGRLDSGGEVLNRALTAQAAASLRNFQITRASAMYDSRAASARVTVDFFTSLLADPTPADWQRNPLDAMAVVGTYQDAAFDRWFMATLERKDAALALDVAERAKRRRYLATQPFGARLLAVRTLLETPEAALSQDGIVLRQQLIAAFPDYKTAADAGNKIRAQLQASPVLASNQSEAKPLNGLYEQWDRNAKHRQDLLTKIAVRRLASSYEFPRFFKSTELQKSLGDGESLVVFHAVGDNMYGFLVSKSSVSIWQLPDLKHLRTGVSAFMHAIGNYGSNRELSMAELKSDAWRTSARDTYTGLFHDAHLDLGKTSSLIIVPDNLLWYLPFEALVAAGDKSKKVLVDHFPIRYGPTAALAISSPLPLRRTQHTGIVSGDMKFAGDEAERAKLLQELVGAVPGPVVMPQPLPEPARLVSPVLDSLIVMDDLSADVLGDTTYLFPRARTASKDKTNGWITMPYGGPEEISVTGFKTEAETGMKSARRGAVRARPGDELFLSLCNLMSNGARSVLITRWRTNGRTNFDLVREFAKESIDAPAAEAWQRACLLARENPVDQKHEPRLKRSEDMDEPPKADHPFFWAGYLLVDTGPRAAKAEAPAEAKGNAPKLPTPEKKLPAPTKPAEPAGTAAGLDKPDVETKGDAPAAEGVAPPKEAKPDNGEPKGVVR